MHGGGTLTALPRVRSKIIPASELRLASKQQLGVGAALPSSGGDSQVQIKSPWVNFSRGGAATGYQTSP